MVGLGCRGNLRSEAEPQGWVWLCAYMFIAHRCKCWGLNTPQIMAKTLAIMPSEWSAPPPEDIHEVRLPPIKISKEHEYSYSTYHKSPLTPPVRVPLGSNDNTPKKSALVSQKLTTSIEVQTDTLLSMEVRGGARRRDASTTCRCACGLCW
jgi:hypothetical protein